MIPMFITLPAKLKLQAEHTLKVWQATDDPLLNAPGINIWIGGIDAHTLIDGTYNPAVHHQITFHIASYNKEADIILSNNAQGIWDHYLSLCPTLKSTPVIFGHTQVLSNGQFEIDVTTMGIRHPFPKMKDTANNPSALPYIDSDIFISEGKIMTPALESIIQDAENKHEEARDTLIHLFDAYHQWMSAGKTFSPETAHQIKGLLTKSYELIAMLPHFDEMQRAAVDALQPPKTPEKPEVNTANQTILALEAKNAELLKRLADKDLLHAFFVNALKLQHAEHIAKLTQKPLHETASIETQTLTEPKNEAQTQTDKITTEAHTQTTTKSTTEAHTQTDADPELEKLKHIQAGVPIARNKNNALTKENKTLKTNLNNAVNSNEANNKALQAALKELADIKVKNNELLKANATLFKQKQDANSKNEALEKALHKKSQPAPIIDKQPIETKPKEIEKVEEVLEAKEIIEVKIAETVIPKQENTKKKQPQHTLVNPPAAPPLRELLALYVIKCLQELPRMKVALKTVPALENASAQVAIELNALPKESETWKIITEIAALFPDPSSNENANHLASFYAQSLDSILTMSKEPDASKFKPMLAVYLYELDNRLSANPDIHVYQANANFRFQHILSRYQVLNEFLNSPQLKKLFDAHSKSIDPTVRQAATRIVTVLNAPDQAFAETIKRFAIIGDTHRFLFKESDLILRAHSLLKENKPFDDKISEFYAKYVIRVNNLDPSTSNGAAALELIDEYLIADIKLVNENENQPLFTLEDWKTVRAEMDRIYNTANTDIETTLDLIKAFETSSTVTSLQSLILQILAKINASDDNSLLAFLLDLDCQSDSIYASKKDYYTGEERLTHYIAAITDLQLQTSQPTFLCTENIRKPLELFKKYFDLLIDSSMAQNGFKKSIVDKYNSIGNTHHKFVKNQQLLLDALDELKKTKTCIFNAQRKAFYNTLLKDNSIEPSRENLLAAQARFCYTLHLQGTKFLTKEIELLLNEFTLGYYHERTDVLWNPIITQYFSKLDKLPKKNHDEHTVETLQHVFATLIAEFPNESAAIILRLHLNACTRWSSDTRRKQIKMEHPLRLLCERTLVEIFYKKEFSSGTPLPSASPSDLRKMLFIHVMSCLKLKDIVEAPTFMNQYVSLINEINTPQNETKLLLARFNEVSAYFPETKSIEHASKVEHELLQCINAFREMLEEKDHVHTLQQFMIHVDNTPFPKYDIFQEKAEVRLNIIVTRMLIAAKLLNAKISQDYFTSPESKALRESATKAVALLQPKGALLKPMPRLFNTVGGLFRILCNHIALLLGARDTLLNQEKFQYDDHVGYFYGAIAGQIEAFNPENSNEFDLALHYFSEYSNFYAKLNKTQPLSTQDMYSILKMVSAGYDAFKRSLPLDHDYQSTHAAQEKFNKARADLRELLYKQNASPRIAAVSEPPLQNTPTNPMVQATVLYILRLVTQDNKEMPSFQDVYDAYSSEDVSKIDGFNAILPLVDEDIDYARAVGLTWTLKFMSMMIRKISITDRPYILLYIAEIDDHADSIYACQEQYTPGQMRLNGYIMALATLQKIAKIPSLSINPKIKKAVSDIAHLIDTLNSNENAEVVTRKQITIFLEKLGGIHHHMVKNMPLLMDAHKEFNITPSSSPTMIAIQQQDLSSEQKTFCDTLMALNDTETSEKLKDFDFLGAAENRFRATLALKNITLTENEIECLFNSLKAKYISYDIDALCKPIFDDYFATPKKPAKHVTKDDIDEKPVIALEKIFKHLIEVCAHYTNERILAVYHAACERWSKTTGNTALDKAHPLITRAHEVLAALNKEATPTELKNMLAFYVFTDIQRKPKDLEFTSFRDKYPSLIKQLRDKNGSNHHSRTRLKELSQYFPDPLTLETTIQLADAYSECINEFRKLYKTTKPTDVLEEYMLRLHNELPPEGRLEAITVFFENTSRLLHSKTLADILNDTHDRELRLSAATAVTLLMPGNQFRKNMFEKFSGLTRQFLQKMLAVYLVRCIRTLPAPRGNETPTLTHAEAVTLLALESGEGKDYETLAAFLPFPVSVADMKNLSFWYIQALDTIWMHHEISDPSQFAPHFLKHVQCLDNFVHSDSECHQNATQRYAHMEERYKSFHAFLCSDATGRLCSADIVPKLRESSAAIVAGFTTTPVRSAVLQSFLYIGGTHRLLLNHAKTILHAHQLMKENKPFDTFTMQFFDQYQTYLTHIMKTPEGQTTVDEIDGYLIKSLELLKTTPHAVPLTLAMWAETRTALSQAYPEWKAQNPATSASSNTTVTTIMSKGKGPAPTTGLPSAKPGTGTK